jgi:type IV pilus assembly protein PilY1
VLLDTTGSMNRLPPDGPSYFGQKLPPGYYMGTSETSSTTQLAAYAANDGTTTAPKYTDTCRQLATDACTSDAQCCSGDCAAGRCVAAGPRWVSPASNARIVGCGLDAVSSTNADFTGSAMYQILMSRRFSPPCGTAVDPSLVGAEYRGQAIDYADQMRVCPYFTSSNNQAVGAPGFDPDYFDATDPQATISGSKKSFFGRNLIFHDNPDMDAGWARLTPATSYPFGHNFRGGFYYNGLSPHLDVATGNKSTIATYCKQQGTASPQVQGGRTHEDICTECLTNRGWYYDGTLYDAGENTAPTPSIWYSGNYLSFFPPKYLVARKVLKDIIAVQSRIRMAMATFAGSGATFIQPFNPSCGMPDTSNFDSNRASYVSSVDGIGFGGGTPMSVALFDVGRYYHSPDLPWFGSSWESSTKESSGTANQYAVCYACQTSSVILITDGQPSSPDGNALPGNGLSAADLASNKKAGDPTTGVRGITKAICPECDAFGDTTSSAYKDNLAKVAFYLQNMDLRRDAETTLDCKGNGGKQVLDTYTIGFATKGLPSVNTLLANAAKAGGGIFVPAENTQALKEGFNAIIEEINGRSTSFSVATVSTLQTMSGRAVHIPRFSPGKTAHWQGHLFRYDLYSEFVNGCTRLGPDDFNCDGRCDGSYLMDRDGDFISEDANGAFVKNDPPNKPTCAQAPSCGTNCAVAGSAPAVPYWDGANAWGYLPDDANPWWKRRNVWTAVDGDGDGDIQSADKGDKMVKFEATDASATDIIPYLALGGGTVCTQVSARFATAGDLASSALVAGNQLECAKSIIRYVLGADLFNERGLDDTQYPPSSQDLAKDRAFILGDIFHSSPVTVRPPISAHNPLCELGLENQCLPALWDTQTVNAEEGYTEFQKAGIYRDRRRIALVGANDGMLHAFNDGRWLANADDPLTPGLKESELLPPGYYESGALDGATELWGFVPPDLLSKLPLLLGTEHQLYVDGTAMVREVWVDGSSNAYASGTYNDVKEPGEFHTVAVTGERRGGTRFFALDVTDATEPGTVPRFLWIYPQPGARESLTFGETYDDLLPTPPPIGPVRVGTGSLDYPTTPNSPKYKHDGSDTPFHETWIAFLNGGFDPQYVRGRGVHMVDVWTGKELFDFSYPDDPASLPADDPRLNLRFPIPASVGMVQWGTQESIPEGFNQDGSDSYFDTANFGDAGGQVWTLRFHKPAKLDANGLATNWFGARLLQMGGQTTCKLCGAQPFFNIVAHLYTPSRRYLRTYLGTGDRFNLTDKYGGTCSPTNIRACVMRGCTVTVTQASNLLSAPGPGFAQRGLAETACGAMTSTATNGVPAACTVDGKVKIEITGCPSPDPNSAPVATTKEVTMTCTDLPDGYKCTRGVNVPGSSLSLSNTSNVPTVGNWFFSLRVFAEGGAGRNVFTDAAGAKLYDANRLWVTQNGGVVAGTPGLELIPSTSPLGNGTEDGQGWGIYYWHVGTVTIGGTSVNVDWKDERTASGTAADSLLVAWNTVMPPTSAVTTGSASCRVSRCTQEDRRVNFLYGADPVTGAASGLFIDASGNMVRSTASYRLVPAQALQHTYFVNAQGQVQQALVGVSPEEGAVSIGATTPEDPVSEGGSLVIDKELYQCRHADSPVCK